MPSARLYGDDDDDDDDDEVGEKGKITNRHSTGESS